MVNTQIMEKYILCYSYSYKIPCDFTNNKFVG